MPKVKMPRSNPSLDMTPMVDLAFLLVTFFMLTSSFRSPEPVLIDPPASTTEKEMPKQVFLVTIDETGRVFIDITNAAVKQNVLRKMMKEYKVGLTDEDVKKFIGSGPLGMQMAQLPAFLALETEKRNKVAEAAKGVPYDTAQKIRNCELFKWTLNARIEADNDFKQREADAEAKNQPFDKDNYMQFVVKAAKDTKYNVVKSVIDVLREARVSQFQMITGLEAKPE